MTPEQLELLDAVDQICRTYPASVTSWWRSPSRNKGLKGSVPNSQHMQGLAVDLVFEGVQPSKAALARFLSPTMQLDTSEPGHLHVEQDPRLLAQLGGAAFRGNQPADFVGAATATVPIATDSSTTSPPALTSSVTSSASGARPASNAGARSPLDKLGGPKGRRRG